MPTTTPQPRTLLNRERVVQAAVALTDEDGTDAVTIRAVAARLSVSPMALYRHVSSKDELMLAVTDVLLDAEGLPPPDISWQAYLTELAQSLRGLFLRHPVLVETFARQPVTTPTARRRLDLALDVLQAGGFDQDEAAQAFAAVHTYTVGFCGLEAARSAAARTLGGGRLEPDLREQDEELIRRIQGFVDEDQFRYGLDAIIRGLTPEH